MAQQPPLVWHMKMLAVGVALLAMGIVFSALWLTLADADDLVTPFIAFQSLIPAFCIVPWVTLITGKPAAAVVLSAFLVGCMKMIAGIVVNLVHGWNYGHHELPWTEPNLMLWSFWVATAVLSVLYLCWERTVIGLSDASAMPMGQNSRRSHAIDATGGAGLSVSRA
jgi:hypothetical protein